MTSTPNTPDITVRGGLINVPSSAKPQPIPRHRPNTPINKKFAKPREDHKPVAELPTPDPEPATTEPEKDQSNVPTETSESD